MDSYTSYRMHSPTARHARYRLPTCMYPVLRMQTESQLCNLRFLRIFQPKIQEGLAVASIVRDDPSTLPGDDPFPRARPHAPRPQCAVNWDRNLKPKSAIMRQSTSVTYRRTDRQTARDVKTATWSQHSYSNFTCAVQSSVSALSLH